MATQSIITKIKNGKITLPKDLQKRWKESEVILLPSEDSVYIKRITPPSLSEFKPKLKKLGKIITQKDINEAIRWARRKVYKSRS